ncbi:craniofacial development protein 2-like [Diabrotica virgifera virgifera]|uniref:Craniofacial development protein 2-like n=1 Tax=Diabrotica virgifera virgifera TaxID=50390 RepID=A0ABM5K670_DIAVI|nr:craniofacial development protein 2-like [Diabrotica virgifera virgifera]
MGDFNAKIGKGSYGEVVGSWRLGERNERRERLLTFATEEELVITNTLFKLPYRRLYTWRSPGDTPENLIRNQIDYILINKRFKNSITSVKAYPGADIKSDHNPLVGKFRLKFKKIHKPNPIRYDLKQLRDDDIKQEVREYLKNNISKLEVVNDVDTEINHLENIGKEILDQYLRPKKTEKKNPWMTDGILQMMDRRRESKRKDYVAYQFLDKEIKKAVREAKNRNLEEQCEEIEMLERKHDSFNLHKKIKEAAGIYKSKRQK